METPCLNLLLFSNSTDKSDLNQIFSENSQPNFNLFFKSCQNEKEVEIELGKTSYDFLILKYNPNNISCQKFIEKIKNDFSSILIIYLIPDDLKIEQLEKVDESIEVIQQSSLKKGSLEKTLWTLVRRKKNLLKFKKLKDSFSKIKKRFAAKHQVLVKSNDYKDLLLSMGIHDIRNPLGALMGYTEILINDREMIDPSEMEEITQVMNITCKQLENLLEDLSMLFFLENGKIKLNKTKNSLKDLIEDRIHTNKQEAEKKNIKILSEYENVPNVYFDFQQISEVFNNLLSNAIKWSPKNSKIFIELNLEDEWAKISVKDQGPGLTKLDQENVFVPFSKLKNKPQGDDIGSQLGLAINKKVMDLHNGTIMVKGMPNEGATFIFGLPLENNRLSSK